jgi:hypothetical protein
MEHFPGCRFIYMVRDPLDVVASMTNMSREIWHTTIGYEPTPALENEVYETLKFYYDYPLAQLQDEPAGRSAIVKYDELTEAPERTIDAIYARFGLAKSDRFGAALREEDERTKGYESKHEYSLEGCTIPRERIVAELGPILERFQFDPASSSGGGEA